MDPYLTRLVELVRSGRDYVVYDTETNGLFRTFDPVPFPWQIAAIRVSGGEIIDRFEMILDWGHPIPDSANLRRIDPATPQKYGVDPVAALRVFSDFVGDAPLVGQRVELFDNVVMRAAFERAGVPFPRGLRDPSDGIDTRYAAELLWTQVGVAGAPAKHSLGDLGRHLGVAFDADALHDAMADVELTNAVLIGLADEIEYRSRLAA